MSERIGRRTFLKTIGGVGIVGGMGTASAADGDDPEYPSIAWYERENGNYAMTRQAPREQRTGAFQERLQRQSKANAAEFARQQVEEPGWRRAGNVGATWGETAAGDPFRYPESDPFYDGVGERTRVAFYDAEGARLSGRVWAPTGSEPGDTLPGVVLTPGSVQAAEPMYWWFAQVLVANGYVVLTYDVRGQGRSDTTTPDGEPGTNLNPEVFVTDQLAAIDFLHSTPDTPYPHTERYGDPDSSAPELSHNPYHDRLDPGRLGICGHSAGAIGVSIVQGLTPWPGLLDDHNPVDVAVAWDNLGDAEQIGPRGGEIEDLVSKRLAQGEYTIEPRVPAMGQSADYYLTPAPYDSPPDPTAKRRGYDDWLATGVPAYELVVRGGTHYEWSLGAGLPATSWRPPAAQTGGADPQGFTNPLAEHYSLAWLDRWLKQSGEQGYDDADERLLADAKWADRLSFYYESARAFPDRQGTRHRSEDIREASRSR